MSNFNELNLTERTERAPSAARVPGLSRGQPNTTRWTPARLAELHRLRFIDGLSCSEIARRLGDEFTANMVIGRLDRERKSRAHSAIVGYWLVYRAQPFAAGGQSLRPSGWYVFPGITAAPPELVARYKNQLRHSGSRILIGAAENAVNPIKTETYG